MFTHPNHSRINRLHRLTAGWLVFLMVFGVGFNVLPQPSFDNESGLSFEDPVGKVLAAGSNINFSTPTTAGTWVVPEGVTEIQVKAWGAGGGGGGGGTTGFGGAGGGGGFTEGVLTVTPGEVLTVRVGGAGGAGNFSSGGAGALSGDGGGGGGYSAVLRGSDVLVLAAGGGAGGGGDNSSATAGGAGGAGGGVSGVGAGASSGAGGGSGGTQVAGGTGGSGGPVGGSNGFSLNGGSGADGNDNSVGPSVGGAGNGGINSGAPGGAGDQTSAGFAGGGGGGAGYFGGGGGSNSVASDAGGGGGGGGSSFATSTATATSTESGSGIFAGNNDDEHYISGTGLGSAGAGLSSPALPARDGLLVITPLGAAWNNGDWKVYDEITIPASAIDATLTDFPVYVDLSDLSNRFWSFVKDDGGDIRITTDSNTELAREVVAIDTAAQTGELHFKADSLSASTDTTFRIWYNGKGFDYLVDQTYGQYNVWSNGYTAVWHLGEDGNTDVAGYRDSTSFQNHGTGTNFASFSDEAGQVGVSTYFDGDGDTIVVPDATSLRFDTDMTMSVWVNKAATQVSTFGRVLQYTDGTYQERPYAISLNSEQTILNTPLGNGSSTLNTGITIASSTWEHVVATWDSGSDLASFYNDGGLSGSLSSSTFALGGYDGADLYIGANQNGTGGEWTGNIDEIRLASSSRSAAWVSAEYDNQSDPDTFYTIGAGSDQTEWNPMDWTMSESITIDAANIDETLSNFPVYVDLSDLSADFWSGVASDGGDIRITNSMGVEIPREIVAIDGVGDTGELHFRADTISSSADTVFFIHYNGTTTGDYSATSTYGAQNVWSNGYVGVWHLGEDGNTTAGGYLDSTAFQNHGTGTSMTSASDVTGRVGSAQNFDGTNDYIVIPADSSLEFRQEDMTFSAWSRKAETLGVGTFGRAMSYGAFPHPYSMTLNAAADGMTFGFENDAGTDQKTYNRPAASSTWTMYTASFESGVGTEFYVDGASVQSRASTTYQVGNYDTTGLGIGASANNANHFTGEVDEIRISSGVRSPAWVKAEHANQDGVTSFYIASAAGDAWNSTDWTEYVELTIPASNVSVTLTDFPVYVDLSTLPTAFWEGVTMTCGDIRVTDNAGSPNELAREVVSCTDSSSTGTGEMHFKATTLSSSVDNVFRIYYGNVSAVDYEKSQLFGTYNVWSNDYVGVWHLGEDGNTTAGGYLDSTAFQNHGTGTSMTSASDVNGQIGNGQDFDGVSDVITVPRADVLEPTKQVYFSAWVERDGVQADFAKPFWYGSNTASPFGVYGTQANGASDNFYNTRVNDGAAEYSTGAVVDLADQKWSLLSSSYDGSVFSFYQDGEINSSSSLAISIADYDTAGFGIGDRYVQGQPFDGVVDEVRIASTSRSAGWISIEYKNQSNPTGFYSLTEPTNEWNSSAWPNYATITIDADKVDDDVTDFPVYIDLANMPSHFWENVTAGCGDIRVTDNAGTPNELAREVVACTDSGSTGTGELHFKATSLSSTTDSVFRIYYGNSTSTDYLVNSTYGAQNVWTNDYVGVWHLGDGDSTTIGFYQDSTGNGYSGTLTDADGDTSQSSGQLGNALDFDGDADFLSTGLPWTTDESEITVSFWSNVETAEVKGAMVFGADAGGDGFSRVSAHAPFSDSAIYWDYGLCCTAAGRVNTDYTNYLDKWSKVTLTYASSNEVLRGIYLDGELQASTTTAGEPTIDFTDLYIGASNGSSSGNHQGDIDEFRISSTARSTGWVATEYENQSDPTSFYSVSDSNSGWNDADWTDRIGITIQSDLIDSTLTDFPVYVDLADMPAAFWSGVASDGRDIRVTNSSDIELPLEIVDISNGVDSGEMHFRADTISASADTTFYIYYNNPSAVAYPENYTYGSQAVWSNGYAGVWHLDEVGNTDIGGFKDATANSNDGTGVSFPVSAEIGQVGGSRPFSGTDDRIMVPSDNSLQFTESMTMSAWVDKADTQVNSFARVMQYGDSSYPQPYAMTLTSDGTTVNPVMSDTVNPLSAAIPIASTTWTHLVTSWNTDDDTARFYGDGALSDSQSSSTFALGGYNNEDFYIGSAQSALGEWTGSIDEVRLSNVARSEDWVAAEYANQKSPNTFYLIDESANEWNDTDWTEYVGLTIPAANVNDDLTDFPVYVDLSDMPSTFWEGVTASCGDVRVTDNADTPTELAREIVSCTDSGSTGIGELHFKATSLSSTTNNVFRIYYGNNTSTDYINNSRYGAHSVWTNDYAGVWHLGEDGNTDSGGYRDSTNNKNDGTGTSMTSASDVSAKLGAGQDFDGVSDYIEISGLLGKPANITLSAWSELDTAGDFISLGDNVALRDFNNSNGVLGFYRYSTFWNDSITGQGIAGDPWRYLTYSVDTTANNQVVYIDGQTATTTTFSDSIVYDQGTNTLLGKHGNASTFLDGRLDEVRVASVARSAAWVNAEYQNQSGLTAFYQVDATPNEWNDDDWTLYDTITIYSENIDETLTDFPVYVDLSDLSTSLWDTIRSDGGDIRVTTDAGTPVELAREVVSASTTVQTGELHFKAPVIASDTNTSFRIWYNGTSGDYPVDETYGAQNVWSNGYVAVWHLENDLSGIDRSMLDSTSNGYTATATAGVTSEAGFLGNAIRINDIGEYLNIIPSVEIDAASDYTYQQWLTPTSLVGSNPGLWRSDNNSRGDDWNIFQSTGRPWVKSDNSDILLPGSGFQILTDNDYRPSFVIKSGVSVDFFATSTSNYSASHSVDAPSFVVRNIGWQFNTGERVEGLYDEIRFSSVARTPAWINAEYINQSITTDFYGVTARVGATSTATLANHTAGQVSDLFDFKNVSNGELFAYRLIPNSGNATVTRTQLTVTDWTANKLDSTDFTNIRLYRDTDNDAEYDLSDELLSSTGVFSFHESDASRGSLVFNDDYLVEVSSNYLVVADWSAPVRGSEFTLNLLPTGLTMLNAEGSVTVSGNVDDVTHDRARQGGGGGGPAAIGGVGPASEGDVGGGGTGAGSAIDTNTDGSLIGNEPDFNLPTASGGAWNNSSNAYDLVDGTYATTSTTNNTTYNTFSHGVLGTDTIEGIEVKLELSGTTPSGSVTIELSWDAGTTWTAGKSTPALTTTDAVVIVGGPADTWAREWTPAETSDANFVVRLTGAPDANEIRVDALQVKIHHQASGGGGGGGGAI